MHLDLNDAHSVITDTKDKNDTGMTRLELTSFKRAGETILLVSLVRLTPYSNDWFYPF